MHNFPELPKSKSVAKDKTESKRCNSLSEEFTD